MHVGEHTWLVSRWEGAGRQDNWGAQPETQLWHQILGRSLPSRARMCPSAVRRKAGLEVWKEPPPPSQLMRMILPLWFPSSSAPLGRQPEPPLPGLVRKCQRAHGMAACLGLTARSVKAERTRAFPFPQPALRRLQTVRIGRVCKDHFQPFSFLRAVPRPRAV